MVKPGPIQTVSFAATVLAGALLLGACTTVPHPCLEGGEPARDAPVVVQVDAEGKPVKPPRWKGTRQCFQRKGPEGKLVNDGRYVEYYPSGARALEGEYKMGKRHGKWLEFDPDGKLISERWFDNGRETETRTNEDRTKKGPLQPAERMTPSPDEGARSGLKLNKK